jgi:tetratricopeptide (TPR) repeat protein
VPLEKTERDALIAALTRLGESSPRARWLSVVHEGLAGESGSIDLDAWSKASREYVPPAMEQDIGELEAKQREWGGTYSAKPLDALASIELAEASLALALKARKDFDYGIQMAKAVARHMLEDARIAAGRAEKLDATPWRVNTVKALAAYYTGDSETAYRYAAAAVKDLPPGEPGWNAMAVLTVFGEGRFKAIKEAAKANEKWPPEWLTDLEAAYTALLHHPLSTDGQVLWHYDLLEWLGVKDRAQAVLESGLERFPGSTALHQRLRLSLLRTKGVREMQAAYEDLIDVEAPDSNLLWYAGYASVVAGDFYRRRGLEAPALAAYDRAIELYGRASGAVPAWKEAADKTVALALAGRARLAYERGDDETATADIIASFDRSPGSVGTRDDLGITPAATAQMLMARLLEREKRDLVSALEAAIAKLDPALLVPEEE